MDWEKSGAAHKLDIGLYSKIIQCLGNAYHISTYFESTAKNCKHLFRTVGRLAVAVKNSKIYRSLKLKFEGVMKALQYFETTLWMI